MRGIAMSSYEWMELQTLTSDIAASRARLAAARSAKDNRLARVLEQEIGEAERRRDLLLANITNQVASPTEASARPDPGIADAPLTLEPAATVVPGNDAWEQPEAAAEEAAAEVVVSHHAAPQAERTEGGSA